MTAILEITDGITTVNLINLTPGIRLNRWTPSVAQLKRGGTFQSSSLSEGSRLVNAVFADIEENYNLKIDGLTQDELVDRMSKVFQLLEKARQYWVTDWQDEVVYLKTQASCETNPRYATVKNYAIPQLGNPFSQPFLQADQIAIFDELDLEILRGHWLADIPGESTCVQTSAVQTWAYQDLYELLFDTASGGIDVGEAIVTSAGTVLFGRGANPPAFLRSTDDGDTWANINIVGGTPGAGGVIGVTQLSNGNILASIAIDNDIHRSTDDGLSWAVLATQAVSTMYTESNDDVWGANGSNIIRSQDGGSSWSTIFNTGQVDGVSDFHEASNGYLFASVGNVTSSGGQKSIWRSTDGGTTWSTVFSAQGVFGFVQLVEGGSDRIFSLYDQHVLIYSDDFGTTWNTGIDFSTLTPETPASFRPLEKGMIYTSDGDLYAMMGDSTGAGDSYVFISKDNGISWTIDSVRQNEILGQLASRAVEADNKRIIFGAIEGGSLDGEVWGKNVTQNGISMGRSATCNDEVYIANKQNTANITHIMVEDNNLASFSSIFPMTTFPTSFFPATPATNDAVYFGSSTENLNHGPFSSLVFDLSAILQIASGTLTLEWEYWNGAWTGLDVTDNTVSFQGLGVNSVHWNQPSDWATTSVNSVTALWVRARISASGSPTFTSSASQQNREIYAIVLPYIEIAAAQVTGDLPALMRLKATNQSDNDGGTTNPTTFDNRVIVGLRSTGRGTNFRAYLNLSDVQTVPGITVLLGSNAAFADDETTPTGRRVTYSAAIGDTSMADRATIDLTTAVARDFYGECRIFLRAYQTDGSAGDISVRYQYRAGTGGIQFTSPTIQFDTTNDWQLLDLGKIAMPAGALGFDDLGDISRIAIQMSNSSGATRSIRLYDIILLPTDEWAADSIDGVDSSSSMIGGQNNTKHALDVDSLTDFKRSPRSLVRTNPGDFATSVYRLVTNGEAILQEGELQRLWFLPAKYGANDEWISEPWHGHSLQLFGNRRYLGMRGDN